ncbi:MAG: GNAT family N-acetyltransferase [Anaerolineae bacterium]|jgi:GNAT superfamily N-acetyltransferase
MADRPGGASKTEIRAYREADAPAVGRLIADTFGEFNLWSVTPEERDLLLGPFRHARSVEPAHQEAIAQAIRSEMVFVAEVDGEIAGVLRGRTTRLGSLFVRGDLHRRGVGRRLVAHFEWACAEQGGRTIKVAATLYAVPFYLEMGYKRTTGVRAYHAFGGSGLEYQPMKKVLNSLS